MSRETVISVKNLVKNYDGVKAINGISLDVYRGEIFGMVGPNGAGKTTTIECLESLRNPDDGTISVLGLNPVKNKRELRFRIGAQLQESRIQKNLKVKEAIDLFASFYNNTMNREDVLELSGLTEKSNVFVSRLSGGQKQRLFIGLALLHNPELVFLDELTTGLDPGARRNMWDFIKDIRDRGKTVFLTTHYMEEAEFLCDRVAVIDRGQIVAIDSPDNLIKELNRNQKIIILLGEDADVSNVEKLDSVVSVSKKDTLATITGKGDSFVADVVLWLTRNSIVYKNFRTEQASLEDVFLSITDQNKGEDK